MVALNALSCIEALVFSYLVFRFLNRVNSVFASIGATAAVVLGGALVPQLLELAGVLHLASWARAAPWAGFMALGAWLTYVAEPPQYSHTPAWQVKILPLLTAAVGLWRLLDTTGAIRY